MMECTQKAGEIIFVPKFVWHSTENLGDVVAIGSQASDFDEMPDLLPNEPHDFCALSKRRSCHDHHVEDLATISSEGLKNEDKEKFVERSQNLIKELTNLAL